jgi:ribosomal protein S18 acetylase RimI-like enzyme
VEGYIVRSVRLGDAEALWRNCFSQNTLDATRKYLTWCLGQIEKRRMVRLVAEADGQAVANAQLTLWPDRGEIGSLVVADGYRRRGIATALVEALTEEAGKRGVQQLEIGARVSEPALMALYQSWGFAPDREIELPHVPGCDYVLYLVKKLPPPEQGES